MSLVTKKKFKIALKKILYTYSFYTMEEYLSQSWIMDCITKLLIILVLVLCTLYKYSLIFYYELITFPCINWRVLFLYYIHKLLLYVFYATKPSPFEIIPLQTTRKESNWKTEKALARAAVTLETERIKESNPWCLWWWCIFFVKTHSVLCL